MVLTTESAQSAGKDVTKKASTAGKRKSYSRHRKRLTKFNKFMQTEVARLKEENPDMPHKKRFKLAVDNWNEQKAKEE